MNSPTDGVGTLIGEVDSDADLTSSAGGGSRSGGGVVVVVVARGGRVVNLDGRELGMIRIDRVLVRIHFFGDRERGEFERV